jgi:hypothetical protein
MSPPAKSRAAAPTPSADELLELLDRAMQLWAIRHREPAELVEAALDRLHSSWAARAAADEPLALPRAAGPRRPLASAVKRTANGRAVKAAEDAERERYIIRRYAVLIRRGTAPKQARELIAAEIRQGRHVGGGGRPAYGRSYSEKSVARVLRRLAGG